MTIHTAIDYARAHNLISAFTLPSDRDGIDVLHFDISYLSNDDRSLLISLLDQYPGNGWLDFTSTQSYDVIDVIRVFRQVNLITPDEAVKYLFNIINDVKVS